MSQNRSSRGQTLRVRLDETEHEHLVASARAAGLTVSDFVRQAVVRTKISNSAAQKKKALLLAEFNTLLAWASEWSKGSGGPDEAYRVSFVLLKLERHFRSLFEEEDPAS